MLHLYNFVEQHLDGKVKQKNKLSCLFLTYVLLLMNFQARCGFLLFLFLFSVLFFYFLQVYLFVFRFFLRYISDVLILCNIFLANFICLHLFFLGLVQVHNSYFSISLLFVWLSLSVYLSFVLFFQLSQFLLLSNFICLLMFSQVCNSCFFINLFCLSLSVYLSFSSNVSVPSFI